MPASTMDKASCWAREGIGVYTPAMGRKAAMHQCARDAGMTPRRLEAILYGEVKRIWAEEYESIRMAYRKWCRDKAHRLDVELAQLRLDLERLDES